MGQRRFVAIGLTLGTIALAAPRSVHAQTARGVAVEVRVTDRAGAPIEGAAVMMEGGPSSRDGATDAKGVLTLQNVRAATYRVRIEHERFTTLEKEIIVRTVRLTVDAALTPAPPPPEPEPLPEPPPPAPAPEPPPLLPGSVAIVSLPSMAEALLDKREPMVESAIGCSGATEARLIVLRDALPAHVHADADEMLYLVAGEASITVGERRQNLSPGWFVVAPRTVSHTVTLRGRNPVILLSIVSGPPCQGG